MHYYLLTYNFVAKNGNKGTGYRYKSSKKRLKISNLVAEQFIKYQDNFFSDFQLFELTQQEFDKFLSVRGETNADND